MLINKHIRIYLVMLVIAILSTSCSGLSDRPYLHKKDYTIALQPIADIPPNTLEILKHDIVRQYGANVVILPSITLPDSFINNEKGKRYSASAVIQYLKKIKPDSIPFIAGITNEDIYTTKTDRLGNVKAPTYKYKIWGIFGLGYKPGSSCIISTSRLQCSDKNKYINRLAKVTLHEIGHNHGLNHCKNKQCLMTDAVETIATVDNAGDSLCNICYQLINK